MARYFKTAHCKSSFGEAAWGATMKVLLVEDNDTKADQIIALCEATRTAVPVKTIRVKSLADGARLLGSSRYDLIVLDLMLPYLSHGAASSSAGLELLRHMRSIQGPNRNSMVVGLSAHPDEVNTSRQAFEQAGVMLLTFSNSSGWQSSLTESLLSLDRSLREAIDVDFIAVCALEEERDGFVSIVIETSRMIVGGLNVHLVHLKHDKAIKGALIRLSNPGLVTATYETSVILQAFKSSIVFMTGICAGFESNSKMGEIIIASPAWEYQAGKWSKDGFLIAPLQVSLAPNVRAAIDHTIAAENFLSDAENSLAKGVKRPVERSTPRLAPSVSGSAVIADAERLKHIEIQHRKLAALDMETYGVYYALSEYTSSLTTFFSVKTVVDMADQAKGDDLHHYGCHVSARAGIAIMLKLLQMRSNSSSAS